MLTRDDITALARLYDKIAIVTDKGGKSTLAQSPELDAFNAEKQRLTEAYLTGLVNHPEYQDLTLNQLRLVASTVVANMLAMVEQKPVTTKRKPGTVKKPKRT